MFPRSLIVTFSSPDWPKRIMMNYVRYLPRPPKNKNKLNDAAVKEWLKKEGNWDVKRFFPSECSRRWNAFEKYAANVRKNGGLWDKRTQVVIRKDFLDFEVREKEQYETEYKVVESTNTDIQIAKFNPPKMDEADKQLQRFQFQEHQRQERERVQEAKRKRGNLRDFSDSEDEEEVERDSKKDRKNSPEKEEEKRSENSYDSKSDGLNSEIGRQSLSSGPSQGNFLNNTGDKLPEGQIMSPNLHGENLASTLISMMVTTPRPQKLLHSSQVPMPSTLPNSARKSRKRTLRKSRPGEQNSKKLRTEV